MPETTPPAARPVVFSVEAGYDSKYVWRGVDVLQFESSNHNVDSGLKTPKDGIGYIGFDAAWNGWSFGVKYIASLSDRYNPVFSPNLNMERYQEYIISLNYSYAVLPDKWLNVTPGFDYYYYPDGDFWGVNNQGLGYVKFVSPHFKWAQPFLDVFDNIATGSANANAGVKVDKLVAGRGFELGIGGGDQVFCTGNVRYGVSYSVGTIYKDHYFYEPDGWTDITASLGLPVSFGGSFVLTPSLNYDWALKSGQPYETNASAWNSPRLWWGVKVNYLF